MRATPEVVEIPGQQLHRRRLAGPIGTQKGDDRSAWHRKRNVFGSHELTEVLAQALRFDHRAPAIAGRRAMSIAHRWDLLVRASRVLGVQLSCG